jgi:hypothetical protein
MLTGFQRRIGIAAKNGIGQALMLFQLDNLIFP